MSEPRAFVLTAPIPRALWSLSWPIAISNQLSILTLSILLFWLGRLVGDAGLAVESMFRPFGLMLAWMFSAPAVGAGTVVSRSVGASNGRGLDAAAGVVTLTVAMWLVTAAIVLPLSSVLSSSLAGGLGLDAPMWRFLVAWIIVTLPGLSLAEALLDVANSTGATRFNLVRVLVDLALMTALAPVLIDVMGIGIAGGPITEGVAALGLAVLLWASLVRKRVELGLGELSPGAWRVSWPLWKELLAIGVPVQLGRVAMFAAQLVLVHRVATAGPKAVAGYGIAGALILLGTMATMGLAQGGAILVGQSLGAGLRDRAKEGVTKALFAGWIVMSAFIALTLASRPVIDLFTDDPAVAAAAQTSLATLRWAVLAIATWQILLGSFAAHKVTLRAGLLIILGEAAGLAVAFTYPGPALQSVCIGFVAGNVVKAAFLLGLVARGTLAQARQEAVSPQG